MKYRKSEGTTTFYVVEAFGFLVLLYAALIPAASRKFCLFIFRPFPSSFLSAVFAPYVEERLILRAQCIL